MVKLSEYIRENVYDIRNNINESVKYYTVNQAIKILKDRLKEIGNPEDKAIAVYNALNDNQTDLYYKNDDGILIKDATQDDYYMNDKKSAKHYEKVGKLKKDILDKFLDDSKINDLYEKGKQLYSDRKKAEAERKKELARIEKNKAFKAAMDKAPHFIDYFKLETIYHAWSREHLWSEPSREYNVYLHMQDVWEKIPNKDYIQSEDCEPGKLYVLSGAPSLYRGDTAPSYRSNIIDSGSVLIYKGDDKWDVVAAYHYGSFFYTEWEDKMLDQKLDQKCKFLIFEDFWKVYGKDYNKLYKFWSERILDDDRIFPYIKNLIKNDEIA